MKRIASIWLPSLAIERWAKGADSAPDSPVVLTVEGTHGLIIHAVTRAAAERGAQPGARLTDARALDPALIAVPADPEGDAALVEKLAAWAGRWSPLVEVDGADGLRLDVMGVAHLFGGERRLVGDVERRFAQLGLTVRVAMAPTAAAAWALARSPSPYPLPQGERDLLEQLAPLHVSALRLDPDTVRTLERLGLKTIGALAEMPRLALARRFRGGEDVVDALDRLTGRKPEPLTAAPADPPPRALLKLEEPATHPEAAAQALERLIPMLVRELERRRLGARRLSLTGYRVDGSIAVASVATAIPSREPKHLQRLLADKTAALNPEFGFDAFALTADWTEELGAAQESLVEEPSRTGELARLIDRLTVKLSPQRVRRPWPQQSHLPERASGWVSAVSSLRGASAAKQSSGAVDCFAPLAMTGSPQRLLDRPEAIDVIYATPEGLPRRFMWRRAVHDIARAEGPERIAPEWWRQPSSARLRDYYCVEDAQGRRYWIYREGLIGDGRGGAPNWFIHGLFG
ncbi:Y-family DNA polymerase [Sphingomonas sp.]|uniref:Y-family DNA polymerase n=1 Tax=Sphingomonas sp. TaxID=28214 RepID=UPI0038AED895